MAQSLNGPMTQFLGSVPAHAVQRHAVPARGHVHGFGRETRDDDAEVGNLKDIKRLLLLLGERVLPSLIAFYHRVSGSMFQVPKVLNEPRTSNRRTQNPGTVELGTPEPGTMELWNAEPL